MKHLYLPYFCLFIAFLFTQSAMAQIRGRAFQDGNVNGRSYVTGDLGVSRIRVRVYDRLGQLLATTSTDTAGYYSLPALPAQSLRLQFDELPPSFHPLPGQFLSRFSTGTRATHDLGLYQPATYTGVSPRLAISIQPIGNHTDVRIDSLGISTIRLLQPGQPNQPGQRWASPAVTGSIWGLAYERGGNQLYSAALAKRHSGFGSLGSGGIYLTDLATGQTTPFVSLDALGVRTSPPNLSRDLSSSYDGRMNDSLMFAQVGKMGLGGIDLSDDERILYTVSLFDGKLYALNLPANNTLPTSADLIGYELPKLTGKGGVFRPFAVKYHGDKVYIGGVCDAQQSGKASDLKGYVYAFDPVTKRFNLVLTIPLDYKRGAIEYGVGNWFPWTDDPKQVMLAEPAWWAIHPQPILSDLEFDTDGSLLIGLMDRLGHQMTTGKGSADGRWQQTISMAAGDVLRASRKRKNYQLETNAQVGERNSAGGNNTQGPAGGEFYFDDTFTMEGTRYHHENGMGGLALLPGSGQLLVSSREPVAEYNSAGISAYDNQTGRKVGGLIAYHHNPSAEFVGRKTNHVGDIEVIRALPPTMLGHRIWQDCNEDGLQNADEPGLGDVNVELWQGGTRLATTRTDSFGLYNFDSRTLPGGLKPGNDYELRVPYQQARYGQLHLVPAPDNLDKTMNSDAVAGPEYALIRLKTTAPGESQLELDFGFRCVEKPQTTAKLQCSGTNWTNARLSLSLNHYNTDERYDLTLTPTYTGRADYSVATSIPAQGQLLNQPLAALTESDLSVRVFKASGCYQDVFVNVTQSAECVQLLTSLDDEQGNSLQMSPNPTHDKVELRYASKEDGPITVQLFGINNHQFYQETVSSAPDGQFRTTLDLSRQTPGLYIILLKQGTTTVSKKVIRY